MSSPFNTRINGSKPNADVLQGVIPALLGLPRGVCDVLGITPLDLLGTATATNGGMGMVIELSDKVTMTVLPFDRTIVFTDKDRLDNRCEISYAGGFANQDVDRFVGWYTLTCRASRDTAKQLAERLDASMIPAA